MNQLTGFLTPIPKPRMTQRDVWAKRPCVLRYRAFCDELRLHAKAQGFTLPERFEIRFWMPMPKSWTETFKAKMLHTPHQQKPDLSNLLKAVEDALLDEDELEQIAGEIQELIDNNHSEKLDSFGFRVGHFYSEDVINEFENAVHVLRSAKIYAERIDLLVSGDEGEEHFIERLWAELGEIKEEE